ncbi:hypothetical protein ECB98_10370 [Brucellaceae bacterium VT-16-1752]|uniref:Amidohydrolase family protein n=1 Tax=Ochrobactrum soli TaxID=2448455 RepID=A0A849KMT2_9HYPH|nr:amidohydrolase family protein [[Ochrobactrum] soli]NNU63001.1 amidohydrolase family protein [[Ochrobactrum] soli]RRD25425.1 hypothetical protein ECB98_10370 [Brucellaceae bacterium VT-16-1752]
MAALTSSNTRQRLVHERKIVVTTLSQIHFHRQAYEKFHYPDWERAVYERHWEYMLRDFQLGLKSGVRFALGTDLIGRPTHPLSEAAMEFVLAVECGMTERQAIYAGTAIASEVLGTNIDTGTLETGKLADIIAVEGDPTTDIKRLFSPCIVMKNGKNFASKNSNLYVGTQGATKA